MTIEQRLELNRIYADLLREMDPEYHTRDNYSALFSHIRDFGIPTWTHIQTIRGLAQKKGWKYARKVDWKITFDNLERRHSYFGASPEIAVFLIFAAVAYTTKACQKVRDIIFYYKKRI